jgi:hypothetical protein
MDVNPDYCQVTGLPKNVESARREIEQHIYQRTGNMPITDPTASIGAYDLGAAAAAVVAARTTSSCSASHANWSYPAWSNSCGGSNAYSIW